MLTKNSVKNTVRMEKKRNGLPVKCVTTNVTGGVTTAGTITTISMPPQGAGVAQRVGDEINIENIELCFLSYYGDTVNVMRYIVFQVKGLLPALSLNTFLQNGASGAPDVTSLYVPFYEGRFFEVLYDKTFALVENASNAAVVDRLVLKPKVKTIPFIPSLTTVTDGQLVILAISDSAIAPNPTNDFTCRMWFRDI